MPLKCGRRHNQASERDRARNRPAAQGPRRWKGNRLESQNTGTELLSFGITAVGSVIASAFAVWLIVFKGQAGDGAGIVLIPILFPCLAAPIPGLICQLIFSKYINSTSSAVIGIIFASLTLVVIYSTFIGTATIKENKIKKNAMTEIVFFKSALEGKFKDDEIRDHYKEFNLFSKYEREAIKKLLYEKNREKISPQAITTIIDLVKNDSLVVGYLADQPETPLEIKHKVAELQYRLALVNLKTHHPNSPAGYTIAADLARNPSTPFDILQKLKDTESTEVKKSLASNSNAPESLLKSLMFDAQKKIDEEMKKPNNQRFYSNYSEIIDRATKNLESRKK